MPNGYTGKILHVDLTTSSLQIEEPPEAFYRKYMGGSAMGLYYILRETPRGVDPLAPENTLTFMTGVTTGAPISGQSRININARSPMSGAIGDYVWEDINGDGIVNAVDLSAIIEAFGTEVE